MTAQRELIFHYYVLIFKFQPEVADSIWEWTVMQFTFDAIYEKLIRQPYGSWRAIYMEIVNINSFIA